MKEIVIRKVENGYYVKSYEPDNQFHGEPTSEELVAKTDKDMIDLVTEFFFGGVLDIAEAPSPEQPSYKHPEKDIFNLSEDEDSTETMIEGDNPFDGVTGQFPLGPATEFKAADASFTADSEIAESDPVKAIISTPCFTAGPQE